MDVSEDSSTAIGTYDYDVFLSFNGSRRRALVDKLYGSLTHAGIHVFKGEELGRGDDIASSLCRAIRRSRISIPIISDDYANIARCLDEVVQMLECRESQGQRIFPVYYIVDPHDIRNQMRAFQYCFTEHERGGIDLDRIETWKKALRQVASLKGWEVSSGLITDGKTEPIISHVRQILKEDSSSVTMDVFGCSSSVEKIRDYDVFLNFEPDVERDFADLLYRRLMDAGVLVVRGEDVPVGEQIVDFVPQAMKRSKICIPVFCRGNVASKWFLDEIAGMAECRKSQGHRVFPVYYQIDPGYIRSIHFHDIVDPDRMGIWKRALREVKSLKGWELDERFQDGDIERIRSDRFQDGDIERIISHVLQSLKEDKSSITVDVSEGSSDLVDRIPDYDVFLNFWSDTGRGFADLLYHRLKDAGVLVFRDEDVPVGEDTLQAIKRSRISIPVFSRGYTRSQRQQRWHKVVQMLECRKIQGHCVFPIYYHIRPGYLSYEVEDILRRRSRVDDGEIRMWEKALYEVASLECWQLDDESIDVDTVKSVISKVRRTLNRDKLLELDGDNAGISATPFEVVLSFSVHDGNATSLYKHMKDAGIRVLGFDELPIEEEIDKDFARAGIRVLGFDELPVEEEIDKDFVRAINNSEICIPFLTKDYLASTQCLRQLTHIILEARRHIPGQQVIPIFYDVEPPDVNLELDSYFNTLKKHEQNFPTEVSRWKEALREVAELQGWKFKAEGFNIKSVVIAILKKLKGKPRSVLVGMEGQLEKLKEVLDVESQDVRFVGIYGIGGVGKTTLARAIFDKLSSHFEGCSFLGDIRETSRYKGLRYLQDQLFRDITCADNDCETKTTSHIFLEKKVLIVLDDVNERGQIKKLVGKANQFVSGSRIIVTTRDINVLADESETLDGRIFQPFKMEEMESTEALQLFHCHAFGEVYPPPGYLRICEEVVSAIGKLPLVLKIMGSFLNHKHVSVWKAILKKLKNLPDHERHPNLMISYEALDHETKELFLDIAYLLSDQEKTAPIYMCEDANPGRSAAPFEVVLSFRVREEVATSFYEHMKDAGIRVFGSDELPVEEEIDKEFVRAINNSEICIPFLTKDYLASTQCLRQLTHIMEARRNIPGQQVIPIFYDVQPPDVKLETDSYINLLKDHEQNFPTEVSRWKEALREVAELQGWKFKDEGFNIKSVMIAVLNKLKEKHRSVLVGMDDQLEKLKEVLDVESQDVRIVGIYGNGGVGKTTLARAVFDKLSTLFEGCSFLKDIRETAKCKGLRYLRDQLFRDITCADNDCETKTTRHIFLEKKVIIVLDDVNERGQIKKLVGKANRFVSRSWIIVTTRDINVLAVERELQDGRILEWPKEVHPFKMKEMESTKALQLFCFHAFGKVYPPLGYLRICGEVVSAIGKLPLALEIMGSFLNHKPGIVWKETLEKLKNPQDYELHTKLMISYEALDLKTKEVFLDIACFFTGQEKNTPTYMWEACELLPELGIEALTFLSFVKILGDNRLWMHNKVREFGRKIIYGGCTMDSAKGSRLWVNEEVMDILRSNKVNENVQGLKLMFDEFLQDSTFPPKELESMPNLRFLELSGFPFAVKRALPKLRWLSWHFCSEHVKASDLYLENLVILDLSNSYVSDELGKSGQLEMAKNLKVLDLTNCKRITKTPIFSDCMILERLILEGCEKLVKIDRSIGNLKQLMYLNLNGCYSLEELPNELGSATALTELIMKGNGQPFKLQESLFGLTSLSVLEISNVKIVDPVVHIGNSKKLERLILSECCGSRKLYESGQFFASLVKLDLSGSEIICLPDSIGEMKNLKVINVESSMIRELPVSIGNLEKLEELHAKKCRCLKGEIPNEIGNLYSLGVLDLSFTRISSLPTTLSNLSNLQTLNLEFCDELEKLPELPTSLVSLHVMSKKLRTLPDLSKMNCLVNLKLFCPIDKFQADWIGKLSRLEKLDLCIQRISVIELGDTSRLRSLSVSCKETGSLAHLPLTLSRLCLAHLNKNTKLPSLCNLKSLTFIEFYNCSIGDDEFKSIETDKLESLEHLSACKCNFSWDHGLPLPERLRVLSLKECKLPSLLGLQTLKNLMHLELIDCQELTEIRGLDKLESLEEIIIYNCNSLEKLGDLSDLKKLKALQIHSCEMLREVVGLERMNILKQLEICCCKLLESSPDRLKLRRSRKLIAGSAPER